MRYGKFIGGILAAFMAFSLASGGCSSSGGISSDSPGNDLSEKPEISSSDDGFSASDSSLPELSDPDSPKKKMTAEEVFVSLGESAYRDWIETDDEIGVSAPEEIGVRREALSFVRYSLPGESEFDFIYEVGDYGVSSASEDNLTAFSALVRSLQTIQGKKLIRFGEGVYRFSAVVLFDGITDLYIDGEGAEWLLTSWDTAFRISDCENVHINGLKIDFENPSNISGSVTETTPTSVTFRAYDEFDLTYPAYRNSFAYGSYIEYKEDNGAFYPDAAGNLLYNSTGDGVKNIAAVSVNAAQQTVMVTFRQQIREPACGTLVSLAFTMYEHTGVYITDSEDVYFEGVELYAAAGMGITASRCRNLYFNRTNVRLREGSKRLMTATADGLHCMGCTGDLIISGCIIENTHDDGINICSFYKTVQSYSVFDKKLILSADGSDINYEIGAGDLLEFYDPADMSLKSSATVDRAIRSGDLTWEVTLRERITGNLTGLLVGNDSESPSVTLVDTIIRNKRNRGILCQFRRSTIERCAFINILHGAVTFPAVRDVFGEAVVPRSVTVKNTKFINNGEGKSSDVIVLTYGSSGSTARGNVSGIVLENNAFIRSAYTAVIFNGAGESRIDGNLFLDPYNAPHLGAYQYAAIETRNTENVSICGNLLWLNEEIPTASWLSQFKFLHNPEGDELTVSDNVTHNATIGG